MALTDTQKAQVRQYLGWERGYDRNSKLEDKLANLSSEEETLVVAVLTKLAAVDTAIDSLTTDSAGRVVQVDEVRFADRDPFEQYRDQGRRLVARLTALLGVDINRDFFGDGGAPIAVPIPLG